MLDCSRVGFVLQNGNVLVDLCSVSLRNALGDPDDVSHFLLLELYESVENSKVELVQIGMKVQFHLKKINVKIRVFETKKQTSYSKNLSSKVFSPGLIPLPSNSAL